MVVEIVLAVRRRWRDLLLVVVGLAVELAVFLTVNEVVRRPRPSVTKLGIEPATFSFPSGHVAATGRAVRLDRACWSRSRSAGRWWVKCRLAGAGRVRRDRRLVAGLTEACTTSATSWPERCWASGSLLVAVVAVHASGDRRRPPARTAIEGTDRGRRRA